MMSYHIMSLIGAWMIIFLVTWIPVANGNHDARRLYDDLMRKDNYNKMIRPAKNVSDKVAVKLGLKLSQLQDVDEKNQMISLNMWLIHEWTDHRLAWIPRQYGNVTEIYVPSESLWIPDIVLYNTADGDYTVTIMTKASLDYRGVLSWQPPVIFKSQCDMNVEFFPFDEQKCLLKFGAWSYGDMVKLEHVWMHRYPDLGDTDILDHAIDLKDYYPSAEWDIMDVPAQKHIVYYPCCTDPYPDITFYITLRRKTLYFTYSLIIPCVSINMLTVLTFYLPSDSGEKISLCISILLSLSVFQLLLMDLIPATSLTVPLIGKYILFTMVLVSLSVFISVLTLNVNFRSSATHELPDWAKKIFHKILPRILFMKRPQFGEQTEENEYEFPDNISTDLSWENPYREKIKPGQETDFESLFGSYSVASTFIGTQMSRFVNANVSDFCYACAKRKMSSYPPSAKKALEGSVFIAKHLKDEDDGNKVKEDWIFLALVLDRLFLFVFLSVMLTTALGILMNAPSLYDGNQPLDESAE